MGLEVEPMSILIQLSSLLEKLLIHILRLSFLYCKMGLMKFNFQVCSED